MHAINHAARLLGLAIYISLGAIGCAATVYSIVRALFDFVFNVNISVPEIVAAAAGTIVCFTLYSIHAEHIRESLDQFRRPIRTSNRTEYRLTLAAIAGVSLGIAVLIRPIIFELVALPNNTVKAVELNATTIVPANRLEAHDNSGRIAKSDRLDSCALREPINIKELELCVKKIGRNQPTDGVGGGALDVIKDGDELRVRRRSE